MMCASEIAPLAKTGGLADVVLALAVELRRRGHDVRCAMPLHGSINRLRWPLTLVVESLGVPMGYDEKWCSVHQTHLPGSDVPVYLFEHRQYYAREDLYSYDGTDYDDNSERFAFLSRATLQLCKALHFSPDILHGHDWQAALLPLYLKTREADHPLFWKSATVQTIHNLGYQGVFPRDHLSRLQLGWEHFTIEGLEFHGQINFLKSGIHYADQVTTVSPTYAREIVGVEHGWGLEGVLKQRGSQLTGILNGCDYDEWNPLNDREIPEPFDIDRMEGKGSAKEALQRLFDLRISSDVPIIAVVSRLAYQKGMDVLAASIEALMQHDLQLVIVGRGEVWSHFFFGGLPVRYPGRCGAFIGFNDHRAHLAIAGSDFFLMPSRYEPCGLSQLSSKRYGSVPIVRATGGLNDTIENYDEQTGSGDGFKFHDLTPDAIVGTSAWAVKTWRERPEHYRAMQKRGMAERFDWGRSANSYEQVYEAAVRSRQLG